MGLFGKKDNKGTTSDGASATQAAPAVSTGKLNLSKGGSSAFSLLGILARLGPDGVLNTHV